MPNHPEEKKMSDELRIIEEHHGFTFGDDGTGDTAEANLSHALTCSNKNCPEVRKQTQIHADTILPVLCGGCSAVLHCDHQWEKVKKKTGTLGAPILVTHDFCPLCAGTANRVETNLPPVNITDLPIDVIAALIHQPHADGLE